MRSVVPVAAALLAAGLTACAKSPESIAPSYVSDLSYRPLDCRALAVEAARLETALARAATQQQNARTNDTIGVILIGLPVSSLSGDNIAPEIARLKGEQETVARVAAEKRCGR